VQFKYKIIVHFISLETFYLSTFPTLIGTTRYHPEYPGTCPIRVRPNKSRDLLALLHDRVWSRTRHTNTHASQTVSMKIAFVAMSSCLKGIFPISPSYRAANRTILHDQEKGISSLHIITKTGIFLYAYAFEQCQKIYC
jgi:hypothetical protein